MLIVSNIGAGVQSIDEAIQDNLVICIPEAIHSTVSLNYPLGKFHEYGGSSRDFARLMHAGQCDAAVIHRKRIDELHAGWIHGADCEKVERGELTEEEGRCETSVKGGRDDCSMIKVGDVILSVPIAFPVHSTGKLVTPMSVAITKAQNAGEWEAAVKENDELFPKTMCDDQFASGRVGKEAFAGVSFIVGLGVAVGLIVRWAQHTYKLKHPPSQQEGGPSVSSTDNVPPTEMKDSTQPKVILDKLAEVTQLVRALEAQQQLHVSTPQAVKLSCDSGVIAGGEFVRQPSAPHTATVPGGASFRNGSGSGVNGNGVGIWGNGNGNGNGVGIWGNGNGHGNGNGIGIGR